MKKILCSAFLSAAVFAAAASYAAPAYAADDSIQCFVEFSVDGVGNPKTTDGQGNYGLVTVKDLDGDGDITINDAMIAGHDAFYPGGSAAGYKAAQSQWGLSVQTLWGVTNGGSYGYVLNDKFANGLTDKLTAGTENRLTAYVYQDTTAFSDRYSYFVMPDNGTTISNSSVIECGAEEIQLKVMNMYYGADFSAVNEPLANATITVNGEKTKYVTDKDGLVTIKQSDLWDSLAVKPTSDIANISAVSDSVKLVPAYVTACMYKWADKVSTTTTTMTTTTTTTTSTTASTTTTTSTTVSSTTSTTTTTTTTDSTTTTTTTTTTTAAASPAQQNAPAAKTGDWDLLPVLVAAGMLAGGVCLLTRRRDD